VQNPANTNPLENIIKDVINIGEAELKWMLADIFAAHFAENGQTKIKTLIEVK
jgi:hypothetical protein